MEDKHAAFLAAIAGLVSSPSPSTHDEALLKAIVDRLSTIQTAANAKELPTVGAGDKDKYLHTKSTDGTLEWVESEEELPVLPDTDGSYELLLTITDGTPVLTWEAVTT